MNGGVFCEYKSYVSSRNKRRSNQNEASWQSNQRNYGHFKYQESNASENLVALVSKWRNPSVSSRGRKTYKYQKGLVELPEIEQLKIALRQKEVELEILKKYKALERKSVPPILFL